MAVGSSLVLWLDTREGGSPRYEWREKDDPLPKVPDWVLKSVVFIGGKKNSHSIEYQGTAYVVGYPVDNWNRGAYPPEGLSQLESYPLAYFLVTAQHVLAKPKYPDDVVAVRVNNMAGGLLEDVPPIPIDQWVKPATDEEGFYRDLAVVPWEPPAGSDLCPIRLETSAHKQRLEHAQLGPGTSLFLTGLYHRRTGKNENKPIVRHGSLAALASRDDPVKTSDGALLETHLAEIRSFNGLSGSPVFARTEFRWERLPDGEWQYEMHTPDEFFLLGHISGHWEQEVVKNGNTERLNEGLAWVIPVDLLLDVIESEDDLKNHIQKVKKEQDQKDGEGAVFDSAMEEPDHDRDRFLNDLHKATRRLPEQSEKEES